MAGRKWNSIGKIISKALIDSDIKHEEFMLVSNEGKNYQRLKDGIRRRDSQQVDIERGRLKEPGENDWDL